MKSIRALLEGIVDYAGLFPPARLPMAPAVANYAAYARGPHAWMLGRFVLPAGRLVELTDAARDLLPGQGEQPWELSALAGDDPAAATAHVAAHRAGPAGDGAKVVSLEMKAAGPDKIRRDLAIVPEDLEPFFEIPADADPTPMTDVLRGTPGRAKIRTGGVTERAIPAPEEVARFLLTCARAGVPLKATAGLHHPMRGTYPLTYEKNGPSGTLFGFLNLFIAAAFAAAGLLTEDGLVTLLVERDASSFAFDDDGLTWGEKRLALADLRDSRESFALSYGSCSFTEPVEDLRGLRLLPD